MISNRYFSRIISLLMPGEAIDGEPIFGERSTDDACAGCQGTAEERSGASLYLPLGRTGVTPDAKAGASAG